MLCSKGLACIVAYFVSQASNGFISIAITGALGFLVYREASEFIFTIYSSCFRESPLYLCRLLEIMGFLLVSYQNGSPESGHDITGQISPFFLPDTIGLPGSKNDVNFFLPFLLIIELLFRVLFLLFVRFSLLCFAHSIILIQTGSCTALMLWTLASINMTVSRPRAMERSRTAMKSVLYGVNISPS